MQAITRESFLPKKTRRKSVKKHFGIQVKINSLTISESSTHKTVYKEGEKFSLKGLVLVVNYEDYSTDLADMGKIILESTYDTELTPLNRYVYVEGTGEYAGLRLMIPITVTEAGATENENSSALVIGLAVGGSVLGLIVVAAAVILILKYAYKIDVLGKIFKKSKKTEIVTDDGNDSSDGGTNEE